MRLFNIPVPIIALMASETLPLPDGPQWFMGAISALFFVAYLLKSYGKLPGSGGERREASFQDADRKRLEEVHKIMVREDPDKTGYPMVWGISYREHKDVREGMTTFTRLAGIWEADRTEWHEERARLERRVTVLEETVRTQETALLARGRGA